MACVWTMSRRCVVPELMDDPSLDVSLHRQALRGLARINRVSGSAGYLWRVLSEEMAWDRPGPRRVLDVACGGGEVAIGVQQMAAEAGRDLLVDGCDISQQAIRVAEDAAAAAGVKGRFFVHDAISMDWPGEYDAVVSGLFLHHLLDEQVVHALSHMASAAPLVIADDLVRCRRGYLMAWLGTRALSGSRVVHVDGPRSVRAAFTEAELIGLALRAGLHRVRVRRRFPSRMCMIWRRD